jgi:hypothetical protein
LSARDELEEFRNRNRLSRPAREPTHRWTTLGVLFIFVTIESLLNDFLFAKGSAFDLEGGVGTAVVISLTNGLDKMRNKAEEAGRHAPPKAPGTPEKARL